jgi:hypothetical protein
MCSALRMRRRTLSACPRAGAETSTRGRGALPRLPSPPVMMPVMPPAVAISAIVIPMAAARKHDAAAKQYRQCQHGHREKPGGHTISTHERSPAIPGHAHRMEAGQGGLVSAPWQRHEAAPIVAPCPTVAGAAQRCGIALRPAKVVVSPFWCATMSDRHPGAPIRCACRPSRSV